MRTALAVIAAVLIAVVVGWSLTHPSSPAYSITAKSLPSASDPDDDTRGAAEEVAHEARVDRQIEELEGGSYVDAYGKDACTKMCAGHEAGWKWAAKKNINDEKLCPLGNSKSFHDGCVGWSRISDLAEDQVNDNEDVGANDTLNEPSPQAHRDGSASVGFSAHLG